MSESFDFGKKGEELAAEMLTGKGYEVIARNWRFRNAEIDIIAKKNKTVVFVEVKTRKSFYLSEPSFTVNKAKQKLLIGAADAFIKQKNLDAEARFDIVSIVFNQEQKKIEHLEDAFYPSL